MTTKQVDDGEELEPHKMLNYLTALEHQVYRNHEYAPDGCSECAMTQQIADKMRERLNLMRRS